MLVLHSVRNLMGGIWKILKVSEQEVTLRKRSVIHLFVIMEFMLLLYTFQVYLPFRLSDPQRQMSYYFSCYFQHLICNWYIVNPKRNQS